MAISTILATNLAATTAFAASGYDKFVTNVMATLAELGFAEPDGTVDLSRPDELLDNLIQHTSDRLRPVERMHAAVKLLLDKSTYEVPEDDLPPQAQSIKTLVEGEATEEELVAAFVKFIQEGLALAHEPRSERFMDFFDTLDSSAQLGMLLVLEAERIIGSESHEHGIEAFENLTNQARDNIDNPYYRAGALEAIATAAAKAGWLELAEKIFNEAIANALKVPTESLRESLLVTISFAIQKTGLGSKIKVPNVFVQKTPDGVKVQVIDNKEILN